MTRSRIGLLVACAVTVGLCVAAFVTAAELTPCWFAAALTWGGGYLVGRWTAS